MREILFRGKNKYNGEWAEGYYTKGFRNPEGNLEDLIYIFSEGEDGRRKFDYAIVTPETVGQYTGLTDKNGTKIFEGDILKIDGSIYCVHFCNGTFGVVIKHGSYAGSILKVANYVQDFIEKIGNIYDNIELWAGVGANNA